MGRPGPPSGAPAPPSPASPPTGGIAAAPLRERSRANYLTGSRPVRRPDGAGVFAAFAPDGGPAHFSEPARLPMLLPPVPPGPRAGVAHVRPGLTAIVLVELAGAAALLAWVGSGGWRLLAGVVALLALVLGLVPIDARPAYQWVLTRWARRRRHRLFAAHPGPAGLVGGLDVVAVPAGNDTTFGALRSGPRYTCVLEILDEDVLAAPAPITLADLDAILTIENVPLDAVRLVTVVAPWRGTGLPEADATAAAARAATRYCLLTFDARRAAEALAARGGSQAAVEQILRRCVLRAREILANSAVAVRAVDEAGVAALLGAGLGPAGPAADLVGEDADGVRVAGTYSLTVACAGAVEAVLPALAELGVRAPGAIAAPTIVVRPGHRRQRPHTSALVRVSVPDGVVAAPALRAALLESLGAAGLTAHRLRDGQAPALASTLGLAGASTFADSVRDVSLSRTGAAVVLPGPDSAITLGADPADPGATVRLRLFRADGLRLVAAGVGSLVPVVALRAAVRGSAVRVRTARPQLWRAGLHGTTDSVVAPYGPEPATAGTLALPVLVVDDRPGENAPPGDVQAWQCRLDVRAPLNESDVAQYAAADAVLTGPVAVEVATAMAELFDLSESDGSRLARLAADHVAIVGSRTVRVVQVQLSGVERERLHAPRPVPPASPAWPAQPAFPGPTPTGSIPVPGRPRTPSLPPALRPGGALPTLPRVGPAMINAGAPARPATPQLPPAPQRPPRRPAPSAAPVPPPPPKPALPPPPARPAHRPDDQRPDGPRHAQ